MTQPHDAQLSDTRYEHAATPTRFDQATRIALTVVAVVAALFALAVLAHTGPMLLGAGCRWAW